MAQGRRPIHNCEICGVRLIGEFYYSGRCALHQTTKDADAKLTSDAVKAKQRGLSYGQYMAAKEAGKV